jgi:polysaccharide pyruvyl transferase CsaB
MQAILCGYYGQGNGGDEALLASLLQMLPPHVKPLVLSGNPLQTEQAYGVMACDRKSPRALLSAFRQSDAFIWGGGSLMQDATSALNPVYYGGLMGLAQRQGLKTIAWAQGIGPLHRPLTRWLTQQTFARCSQVSVRDRAAASLLTDWQIPFTLAPDPVWALNPQPVAGLGNFPAPRVAVILRTHPLLTAGRLEALTRALIDLQKATQTYLFLIPFQPVQDLAIAQGLHARLPDTSQILTLTNPQHLMHVFHGVEMAIAMRYHGLIMAAVAGCRCFALSYDPKVTHLMEDLQIPGWFLDQIPTDAHEIGHTWIEHYVNGESLSRDQIHFLVDRALIHREVLHSTLNSL